MHYQSVKISSNRFLILMFIFLCLHLSFNRGSCSEINCIDDLSEIYCIDNQGVLLYKIMNWWYDCQPKDNYLLCGKAITYTNLGNARIEYTQSKLVLKISIQKGLADQLSIFKNCDGCLGPSYLRCIWQNEKYLGKGKAVPMKNLNQFIFLHIDKIQARILKDIEKEILFVVEGNIMGLMNDGKIALHNTGDILKRCPNDTDGKGGIFPITVKIKNARTDEIIARYHAAGSD